MKLEELEKKRDAYAGKIIKLAIVIAAIFIVPILAITGISHFAGIKFMHLFPVAFITSWTFVVLLYRKVSREVNDLNRQIKDIKDKETVINDADITATEHTSL
jgi:archaellum biogenesis protein FlaJ (TadC family)